MYIFDTEELLFAIQKVLDSQHIMLLNTIHKSQDNLTVKEKKDLNDAMTHIVQAQKKIVSAISHSNI